MDADARIDDLGLGALVITFDREPSPEGCRRLAAWAARLRDAAGVRDAVPGFGSLTVHFDPLATGREALLRLVDAAGADAGTPGPGRRHEVAVRYDGEDLEAVAAAVGCPHDEVVARHAAPVYTVAMIGFRPHFPYLLGLDPRLRLPRRADPRRAVPAGAVAIADDQAGIYPASSPGGWHLLGNCDPAVCATLEVGDEVRFRETSCT